MVRGDGLCDGGVCGDGGACGDRLFDGCGDDEISVID